MSDDDQDMAQIIREAERDMARLEQEQEDHEQFLGTVSDHEDLIGTFHVGEGPFFCDPSLWSKGSFSREVTEQSSESGLNVLPKVLASGGRSRRRREVDEERRRMLEQVGAFAVEPGDVRRRARSEMYCFPFFFNFFVSLSLTLEAKHFFLSLSLSRSLSFSLFLSLSLSLSFSLFLFALQS